MKTKLFILKLVIVGCLQLASTAKAAPGEGISFDPSTGDYTVSYFVVLDDGTNLLQKTIFEPATKIEPSVQSKFRLEDADIVIYRYTVLTSSRSRQMLGTVRFDLLSRINGSQTFPANISPATDAQMGSIIDANKKALATPAGWNGNDFPNNAGGDRVSWNPINNRGLQPGASLTGFGFSSQYLPSIDSVALQGVRKRRVTYAGAGPQGDVKQQFDALRQNDFVPRNAAVPTIAVPNPFDAAALLDSIRTQVATWPSKKLLDPAFAAKIDSSMVAAANAYRLNNSRAGKENIDSVRSLLAHEHNFLDHDDEDNDDTAEHKAATHLTIDRLAARALDFDLRYVLKRSEKEHDHDEGDRKKDR
jgi:hypothetical protein